MDNAIELADVISQLRSELSRAMREGEGADLRFEAEQVELELLVALETTGDAHLAVRFWVLDAGASAQRSSTVTQRMSLRLRPVRADAPHLSATIGGRPLPRED